MANPETPELSQAVEELYRTFGKGPLGRALTGCPCCSDPAELARWSETPIEDLSGDDLLSYVYSAHSTVGDAEDFRHFVPRLLDLIASDPGSLDFEEVATQLGRAEWTQWPERQRNAVRTFLDTYWRALLIEDCEAETLDSAVCALAIAGVDIQERLEEWARADAPAAQSNLHRFIEWNREDFQTKRRLLNAFWDQVPSKEILVADWIRSIVRRH